MVFTQNQKAVSEFYIAAFGRSADKGGLDYWTGRLYGTTGTLLTIDQVRAFFVDQTIPEVAERFPTGQTHQAMVESVYLNVLSRAGDASGITYWVSRLDGTNTDGQPKITDLSQIITNVIGAVTATNDAATLTNKRAFAEYAYAKTVSLTAAELSTSAITDEAAILTNVKEALDTVVVAKTPQTFSLTTSVDDAAHFTGGAGNDTFTSNFDIEAGANGLKTLSALDVLNGGNGTDVLNITNDDDTAAYTLAAATISNIETMTIRGSSAVTANVSGSNITGLNTISVTQATAATVTAAATTAVNVSGVIGAITVDGGSTQTVTTAGTTVTLGATTVATGAINVTHTAQAANAIKIDGGTSINLTTSARVASGTIDVGTNPGTSTALPTGAITITASEGLASTDTAAYIKANGGSSISITENILGSAAAILTASTAAAPGAITGGAITVVGGANTTSVSVTQTAAVAAISYAAATTTAAAITGVLGVVNGAVTITDVNDGATTADKITTVTLNSYAASSTIKSAALSTLNLSGTGGTLALDRTADDTTANATTLTATIAGGATLGAISGTHAADFTTVNLVTTGTAASTIGNLTDTGALALTVSGTSNLTLTTSALLANVTSVNVTNTGSTTFGTTTLNTASTFTSGAGAESVIIGATTKAISTGAGNDTVTLTGAALGTAGTVDAGTDTDTLVISSDNVATATATDTFEGTISGFDRLTTNAVQTDNKTINLANLDNINYVSLAGAIVDRTLTLSNVSTGVTVNANAGAAGTIDVTQAVNDAADTINFGISNTTAQTVFKLDASEYETIAITTDDSATTATSIAHIITTLDATAATSLTISGDAGLTVGTLTGTALTSINANGVTAGAVTFTTGALAAASTINGAAGNDVISAASALAVVILSGNAGNDTLTGGTVADTINGGAGADIIDGKAGADSLTGGTGRDIFTVSTVTDSNGTSVDTVTDMVSGTDFLSAGNHAITYAGEAASYGAVLTSFTGLAYQAVMDTSTKTVYIDVNGDSDLTAADIAITTNASDLSQTDFAMLGTTGADAIALTVGIDTVYSLGGADTITAAANTTAIAALSTDTLSIATTGMDIINAVATATINLTAPLTNDANYDTVTNAAAGAVITKTVLATSVNQFVGLYDYATGIFTSSATTAAASASTTDVAASMFLYATADATTADEGIILVGSVANATASNGVLTIA